MFYTYAQNNSGGQFVYESCGISHFVIIEAPDADTADRRAEILGLYFDGVDKGLDCSCCGSRWYKQWGDEGTQEPLIYGRSPLEYLEQPEAKLQMGKDPEGYIHYEDRRVVALRASNKVRKGRIK